MFGMVTFSSSIAVWLSGEDPAIDRLLAALVRADLAGGLPRKLMFIWIEPKEIHGYQISKPVRGAIAMGRPKNPQGAYAVGAG